MEKHYIVQVLIYILDFQSLGSINLFDCKAVLERADEVFYVWKEFTSSSSNKETINLRLLEEKWSAEPITLSAEKIISCCTECIKNDRNIVSDKKKDQKDINSIVCLGGTLEDGWTILKESGTPTAICIGYNLDAYEEGQDIPTCKMIQGPFYSFCSGYGILDKKTDLKDVINKFENSGMDPIAIPNYDKSLPWIDPQLFIFKAKNVYRIKNSVYE